MNVIIANKYASMLQQLNIDIIKSEQGVFTVDDIISRYKNFFFQRMILDITAIKDYDNIKTLQKLSVSLDMDKIILLLDDSEQTSTPEYLSKLISIGIYNFTKNLEGIMYLYNNPNTYRDVVQYHHIDYQEADNAMPAIPVYDAARGVRIIGLKNVTKGAGATTLAYMMKKQLAKNYNVIALEVDKSDFIYFRDKELISTTSDNVGSIIAKNSNKDVIIVDMNNSATAAAAVQDILYIIEPSSIRLNKMMMVEPDALDTLRRKKILLNKSLLSSKDVLDFEYESRMKVFFNLPPLDEREKDIPALNALLVKMGFDKQKDDGGSKKNTFLGLFGG